MLRVHSLIAVVSLFIAASCALSPHDNKQISTSEVSFDGFVDAPGLRVRLEAFDVPANRYTFGRYVTASTTATFAAGAICPNSPALYRYTGSLDLIWPVFWRWLGTTPPTYEAKVRAFKVTSTGETAVMFSTNPNTATCMKDLGFNSTCNFSNIATRCGLTITEARVRGTGSAPWDN